MNLNKTTSHLIISFCSENYKQCLDTLEPVNILSRKLFTDSEEFGIKIFDNKETDFRKNMNRKIDTIQYALDNYDHDYITYLDTDCVIKQNFLEVYDNPSDIVVSRAVYRKDRPVFEQAINAGVIFLKNNERTKMLLKDWKELAEQYQPLPNYPWHEQSALSDLCFEAFDGLKPYTCSFVSERLYNCEHDNPNEFKRIVEKYNPKIIHLKNNWWRDYEMTKFIS